MDSFNVNVGVPAFVASFEKSTWGLPHAVGSMGSCAGIKGDN